MVWHALYMGLSVHPDAATYDLVYTDATSYNAAYWYLMDHPELARELNIDTSRLKFDPKYTQTWITDVVGFRRYEEIGKRNFLSFVSEHPRYLLESMLLYKPKYLVEQILWQAGLLTAWPAWVKIELAHMPPSRHLLDSVRARAADRGHPVGGRGLRERRRAPCLAVARAERPPRPGIAAPEHRGGADLLRAARGVRPRGDVRVRSPGVRDDRRGDGGSPGCSASERHGRPGRSSPCRRSRRW